MKDIPVFTTQHGAASLTLSEIPYTKKAYIRIQAAAEPEQLLQECADFCRAVGAEEIYATGSSACEKYPHDTDILQMRGQVSAMEKTDDCLFPVTEQTLEAFRSIYNEKVKKVPCGAFMTLSDGEKLLGEGSGYFVHKDGALKGIGIVSDSQIRWVAAVVPGGGEAVVQALCHGLCGETVTLEVASANHKAVRLYEKMGFLTTDVISKWYRVL